RRFAKLGVCAGLTGGEVGKVCAAGSTAEDRGGSHRGRRAAPYGSAAWSSALAGRAILVLGRAAVVGALLFDLQIVLLGGDVVAPAGVCGQDRRGIRLPVLPHGR